MFRPRLAPSRSEAPLAWLWAAAWTACPRSDRVVVGGCSRDTCQLCGQAAREPQASHHISSLPSTKGQPVSYYFDWACLDPAGSAKYVPGWGPTTRPMSLQLLCAQGWPDTLLLGPLAAQGQKELCSPPGPLPRRPPAPPRAPELSSALYGSLTSPRSASPGSTDNSGVGWGGGRGTPGRSLFCRSPVSGGPAGARGGHGLLEATARGGLPPPGPLAGVRPPGEWSARTPGRRGREPCPLHAGGAAPPGHVVDPLGSA